MSTMNVTLPVALKMFVDQQVSTRGYGTTGEYVRELIRRDRERFELRALLQEGVASPPDAPAGKTWFERLRRKARARRTSR
jgi:antitoxin ParD1/3/4